ncbi:MAG TPA: class I SAM-dependent methyltransferase [Candidatus Binataceae bacterium]|nr:class I SAM-dependent methyltransferase [Candidatus Binataceae bacterium]
MSSPADRITEYGRQIDFGRTAGDYGRYRAGFPDELYVRLEKFGVGLAGQRLLDLGTGTGYFGRGFARRGCRAVGADISPALMREAMRLDSTEGLATTYVRARAEGLPFRDRSFEVVGAGQCWHWFDRPRAALEIRRVLVPGGRLVLASFDWIAFGGNVAEATEQLIIEHNSRWALAGGTGIHPGYARDAALAGFVDIECFSFDVQQPYSHEAWRGRIRASAGVAASLNPREVARFDDDLRALLAERFPERPPPHAPMLVHHRAFAMVCRAPLDARHRTD